MRNNSDLDYSLISRDECAEKWVIENNFGSNVHELIRRVLNCMIDKRSLTKVWVLER